MKAKYLLFFIAVYLLLFVILFREYCYVMNPDATGYLSVAEKVAQGHFFDSINGIWSPLGSWLLAPFIKAGFNPVVTAKLLNGLYGFISLLLFYMLIKKFNILFYLEIALMTGAVLLLLSFAFSLLFADLLLVMILLLYVNRLTNKNFGRNYKSIIWAAMVGGLGFYAKAYTFYFMLIHLPLVILILEKRRNERFFSSEGLKKILLSLIVLIFISSFWMISLNYKYGNFIVGQRNISGTISALYHPQRIIGAAPEEGNYALFDDISGLYKENITPFTNRETFVIQLKLIITNFFELIKSFNEFSFAFILVILVSLYFLFAKDERVPVKDGQAVLLSFILLWPLGFLLFSVQSRFIWITDIIVMVLCGIILSELAKEGFRLKRYAFVLSLLIVAGFYVYPFLLLKMRYGSGKKLFDVAAALKKNNIKGKMMGGVQSDSGLSDMIIINYLNHSRYYGPYTSNYSWEEILSALERFRIDFYVYSYNNPWQKESFLKGDIAARADSVYDGIAPGVLVLTFKQ